MSDPYVENTQKWLNANYTGKPGYNPITVTGATGWTTIYALLEALQIELGITSTSHNFGPSTTAKFNARFPNGVVQQNADDTTEDNIYGIIQGALLCKGYATGSATVTKHFYSGTGTAIKNLKSDAGCSDTSSNVTLNVMKALLSMDQFVLVNGGNSLIQSVQRTINSKYEDYIGLAPCDGLYGRQMNTALIKVLQAIEGQTPEQANGNFGPTTTAKLPIIPTDTSLSDKTKEEGILLGKYALVCNGYNISIGNSTWSNTLVNTIKNFQADMCIEQTGNLDKNTWMALLLSKGNPDRSFIACDTAYGIRGARIQDLKNRGISIIGRYIVGGDSKELDLNEEKTIIDNGFKLFPIFQNNGTPAASYFTSAQGLLDASDAYRGVRRHCIPKNAIIYFAVDVDVVDTQITNNVLPYFKAIKENLTDYRIGVYGTRNVCSRVMNNGYAITCFVSDMSTGYSGNMGFKMPTNWNFDQFDTMAITNSEGTWYIDKVASSGKFPAVESLGGRYLYEGDFRMTGENAGLGLKYGGDKLRTYVTASIVDSSIDYTDVRMEVIIKALSTITEPIYEQQKFISAPIDGAVHSFADTVASGLDPYNRDYIKLYPDTKYQATYKVIKNGEIVNNIPVDVHISIESED